MRVNCMLGLAGVAVVLPALAAAQQTSSDYDRTAPFAQYRTYAITQETSSGDSLIDGRIVAAVESQLGFRGLRKTNTSPDVYVQFHMTYDKEQEISSYRVGPMYGYGWGSGWGFGYGWGWGGCCWGNGWDGGGVATKVRVRDILIGTLSVDIVDAERGEVVWRGTATKEVDTDDDAKDRDKSVAKAVYKIFKHYPPGFDDD